MKEINWEDAPDNSEWDHELATLAGHPLQSSLWGNSREAIDGIEQVRLRGTANDGSIIALARVEVRKAPMLGRVAWVPRGPAVAKNCDILAASASLDCELKRRGFLMSAIQPWHEVTDAMDAQEQPRTIWIDLSVGESQLFSNLESQWRYGVRRAGRENVVIEQTRDPAEVNTFYELCRQISQTKGFQLPGSAALIQRCLDTSPPDADVEAKFFVARHEGRFGAGAVVIRCGSNTHYLWGGVDREMSGYRTGEAVQWRVIQWAVEKGCKLYDLEGIDPIKNPGTYKFKKKMGGRSVTLPKLRTRAYGARGSLLKAILDRRG